MREFNEKNTNKESQGVKKRFMVKKIYVRRFSLFGKQKQRKEVTKISIESEKNFPLQALFGKYNI
jgi:hypothetical protein